MGAHVIERCDLLIDLHSSGREWRLPRLIGYDAAETLTGRASHAAAVAFGAPVL